jgi:hypothetical protein
VNDPLPQVSLALAWNWIVLHVVGEDGEKVGCVTFTVLLCTVNVTEPLLEPQNSTLTVQLITWFPEGAGLGAV